jgi:hypothetical protein
MGAWEDGFAAGWTAALLRRATDPFDDNPMKRSRREVGGVRTRRKKARKKNPALSRAMKKAYTRSHTKSGKFRKGWNQSRMLKYAHKIKKG